jgi:hypothetical protein
MKSTSAIAGTAVRTITKGVIDMNAGFLATQGAAGGAALAFRGVLGVLGPVLLGITAISGAFKLAGYATDLAKVKIAEFNDIAGKANASNVSTDFFQRFTKSGAAILSLDQITAALKRFNEASTDKLGGSELGQRVGELTKAGNFTGNSGVAALSSSTTNEDKLRAVVKLIDEAMQKGERLAALDIASKAFGAPVAAALQADNGYLDQMLKRADAMSNAKIISPEDVGRAIELKERMDAAQKVLAEKWKPIQDDLAKLGMNYHESWVGITESLASAVGYATALYTALNKVPDWFAKKIGGASVWQSITDATTTPESRAAAEAAHGISSDPADIASVGQNAKLTAALQNHANVTHGMQQATDIQSAVRGDTSKKPTDAKADVNDAVDRAINTLQRHTEQTKADTQAVGLGDAALAKFRAQAAETAAVQANGGKETAEQAAKFKTLQQNASDAADALAKARVAGEISVGRQTAFLTADDVAIAKQLVGIYGNDIPKALASSEAAELRFNGQLKAMSDLGQDVNRSLFVDFETGMRNGKTASEAFFGALQNGLGKIADKLASMAADNLWKAAFGGSGGGIGSLFGFGGSAGGTAGTMNVGGQSYVAFGAHSGMGPGDAPTFTRAVPASTFHGAPRFHSGIGPGEQAAIIRKDESVLTPGQMKQLGPAGGSAVHVNYAPVYQLTGTAEEIQKIKQAAADDRAQFASNVVATIKRAQAGRHL